MLSEDLHIINRDRVYVICEQVAKVYRLTLTDDAVELMTHVLDAAEPHSSLFREPFDGFAWKGYQKRAINVLGDERDVMLQCSPGTGKTLMAIMMACQRVESGRVGRVVVWCPVSLVSDWVRELKRSTTLNVGTPNRSASAAKRAEWYMNDGSDVWVLNYERVRTLDREPIEKALKGSRPLFILDEVQHVKGRKSSRHKELAKLSRHLGACHIALTATPIVRGPEDFYNEFRIIDPKIFGNVSDFERLFTYNHGEKDIWGQYIGYQNLSMMHVMAGAQVFSADKTQPEIAVEFPAKNEILVPYELTPKMRALYDRILDYGYSLGRGQRCGTLFMLTFMRLCNMPVSLLYEHLIDPATEYGMQQNFIDEICRAYSDVIMDCKENMKLALVQDKVSEIVDAGEKAIIFAQHTHNCLYPLGEQLKGFNPLFYTGDVPAEQKEMVKSVFKGDPSRQLLLMSDAGQVGLNFQECRYVIHYQTPITHAAYEQRSDRVHRVDSEFDSIDVMRFMALGTVEERVEETMQGRRRMAADMGFGEFEEVGSISAEDADWFAGFDD